MSPTVGLRMQVVGDRKGRLELKHHDSTLEKMDMLEKDVDKRLSQKKNVLESKHRIIQRGRTWFIQERRKAEHRHM
jgi:hypothetical protein